MLASGNLCVHLGNTVGGGIDREPKSWPLTVGKVITGIVYAILVVYIVILTLAFFLRLFGANPSADFAEWVYTAASRIMEPFRGIFPTTTITDAAVFDPSLLFAIIVYSIVTLALHSLIAWFTRRLSALKYQADRVEIARPGRSQAFRPDRPRAIQTTSSVPPTGTVAPPPPRG